MAVSPGDPPFPFYFWLLSRSLPRVCAAPFADFRCGAVSRRFLNSLSEPEIGVCTLGGFFICVDYAANRICKLPYQREGEAISNKGSGGKLEHMWNLVESGLGVGNSQISPHFSRHCTSQMNLQWLRQLICSLINPRLLAGC